MPGGYPSWLTRTWLRPTLYARDKVFKLAQVWVCVFGTKHYITEGDVPRRAILLGHYFITDWGLTPPSQLPMPPPPGDIVPVQDDQFIVEWRLAPPGWPPTLLSGDIIPVQDGQFIADWRLAPPS
uniref:Uncharacterized protein n=1 Tax=Oryza punctata TaxID=4537 RepID=A0A0E0JZD3_ORYPU